MPGTSFPARATVRPESYHRIARLGFTVGSSRGIRRQPLLFPMAARARQPISKRTAEFRLKRSNGVMNRLRQEDAPVHEWFRFVLSFPPHLVRTYAERFGLGSSDLLLDPFCGTGTTLVEAKKLGIPSQGIEALPMPHLAATAKTDWSIDPDGLEAHSESIAARASETLRDEGIIDTPVPYMNGACPLRTLPESAQRLLVANSISPMPLHKTLTLKEAMQSAEHPSYSRHERLALAASLVNEIGNLRFGPEVGIGRIRPDAAVITPWRDRVSRMASDIRRLSDLRSVESTVHLGDARDMSHHVAPKSISAVITSPPYPNEKDYTRTVRLESVILGFLDERQDLRESKQALLRSNTRSVYSTDTDDKWVERNSRIQGIAERIESRRLEAGKNSGFERLYHRVTKLYFGGMVRHFTNLAPCLKPGARLAYVVGDQASYLRVMIRTGELLAEIAQSVGYEVEGIDLFRTRPATATRSQLREEVLVLRWPGES